MSANAQKSDTLIPLCVDLDGTLIHTDMLWESLVRLLQKNPLYLFPVFAWWARGRARLKAEIASRVAVNVSTLPYNGPLIEFLRAERTRGRRVLLVTASDAAMGKAVANHLPIFDGVLASNGKLNLRGRNKGEKLAELFGERGFDYAGNSTVDLPVWQRARAAIVVNGSPALCRRAFQCAEHGPVFPSPSAMLPELAKILMSASIAENAVVLLPCLLMILSGIKASLADALVAVSAFLFCHWGALILAEWFALDSDRSNPARKNRPFASGALKVQTGPTLGPLLIVTGLALAVWAGVPAAATAACFTILAGVDSASRSKASPLARGLTRTAQNMLRLLAGWAAAGL